MHGNLGIAILNCLNYDYEDCRLYDEALTGLAGYSIRNYYSVRIYVLYILLQEDVFSILKSNTKDIFHPIYLEF